MNSIIDEYGEAILGSLAAIVIIGVAYFVFKQGGILEQVFSYFGNNSI